MAKTKECCNIIRVDKVDPDYITKTNVTSRYVLISNGVLGITTYSDMRMHS